MARGKNQSSINISEFLRNKIRHFVKRKQLKGEEVTIRKFIEVAIEDKFEEIERGKNAK